jgi:hypothetical protein
MFTLRFLFLHLHFLGYTACNTDKLQMLANITDKQTYVGVKNTLAFGES